MRFRFLFRIYFNLQCISYFISEFCFSCSSFLTICSRLLVFLKIYVSLVSRAFCILNGGAWLHFGHHILAGIHFEFLLSVCGESIYLVADNIRVICYENETITSTFGAQHSCWRCSSPHPSPRRWSLSISCVCGQFKVYFCTGRAKDAVAVSSQQKWMIDSMLSKSAKRANESNWVESIRIWWRVVSMSMSTHQGFIHFVH